MFLVFQGPAVVYFKRSEAVLYPGTDSLYIFFGMMLKQAADDGGGVCIRYHLDSNLFNPGRLQAYAKTLV